MIHFSEHLTLYEIERSTRATALGIDNRVPFEEDFIWWRRAYEMAVRFEWVRTALGGHPLYVTSGYRCPPLNDEVGGVVDSRHLILRALDVRPYGSPTVALRKVQRLKFIKYAYVNAGRSVHFHW